MLSDNVCWCVGLPGTALFPLHPDQVAAVGHTWRGRTGHTPGEGRGAKSEGPLEKKS